MPSPEDIRAVVWFVIFLAGLGAIWITGRSKVREKLIADLQAHNTHLQERLYEANAKVIVLTGEFRDDILREIRG